MIHEYIDRQVGLLGNLLNKVFQVSVPEHINEGIAFGAGDSLAVSMALQYLTGFGIISVDPLTLIHTQPTLRFKHALAISYKGRTKSVVKVVRILRERGLRVVGLTSDYNSELARSADIIMLAPKTIEEIPVGVSSFLSLLLTGAKLVGTNITVLKHVNFVNTYMNALSITGNTLDYSKINEVAVISEGIGLAAAYYICLKFYEVLCMPCRVYPYEELLHAVAFSLGDRTLLVGFVNKPDEVGMIKLVGKALKTQYITFAYSGAEILKLINYVMAGLALIRSISASFNIKEPCFMDKKELLKLLTNVIYY